jgi:hypothetical protein
MEVPWTTIGRAPAGHDAQVMASRFLLRSAWRSPQFLVFSLRILRQARTSQGILGVSLRAYPLRGTFWTLSAWTDEAALGTFARTDPHRTIIGNIRPWTEEATFRFWTVPADALAPKNLWAEAGTRIERPAE